MNFKRPKIQVHRKGLSALKLKQMEGTTKITLVKQGLVGNTMDRHYLPKKVTSQVIQDTHLTHMHTGGNSIVQQAQKFVWTLKLYTAVRRELTKCAGGMQKHEIQKDV